MKEIRVYPTRIELEPYELGEYPGLEKMCSAQYDIVTHRREPLGFLILGKKMIMPRGISINYLAKLTDGIPTFFKNSYKYYNRVARMKYKYAMKSSPRDEAQKEAINFLLSKGQFESGRKYSQLALNLGTDMGKTFCTVYAILEEGVRAIIITHRLNIKEQWLKTLLEKTNIPKERILDINSGDQLDVLMQCDVDYDVLLIGNQTISSYAKSHGLENVQTLFDHLQCGIKVIDEAHLCFRQVLMIDFFSNVPRNYYLTATFRRGDMKEAPLFNRAFANAVRFGSSLKKQKNILYTVVLYNSMPTSIEQAAIHTSRGPSPKLFSDYAFTRDPYQTILGVLTTILEEVFENQGKVLIVIPKIDYCELVKEYIQKHYEEHSVGTIHSRNGKKENERTREESQIIISTIGGLGTGTDIDRIKNLIIMEPHSSTVTAEQLIGRLGRSSDPNEELYVYELIDSGFEPLIKMFEKRLEVLRRLCKEVVRRKE